MLLKGTAKDVTVVATGIMVNEAATAAQELSKTESMCAS